jgi:hypothetical protein
MRRFSSAIALGAVITSVLSACGGGSSNGYVASAGNGAAQLAGCSLVPDLGHNLAACLPPCPHLSAAARMIRAFSQSRCTVRSVICKVSAISCSL